MSGDTYDGIAGVRAALAALAAGRAGADLPTRCVDAGAFVAAVADDVVGSSPGLTGCVDALGDHLGCAGDVVADLVAALYSPAAPVLGADAVAPLARPGRALVAGALAAPDAGALRAACAHDRFAAGMAAVAVAGALEPLAQAAAEAEEEAARRGRQQSDRARAAAGALAALDAALADGDDDGDDADAGEGGADGDGGLAAALAAARAVLDGDDAGEGSAAGADGDGADGDGTGTGPLDVLRAAASGRARDAVAGALADADAARAAARAVGLGPGALAAVDPDVRLRLAAAVRGPGFAALMALLGRMRARLAAERAQRIPGGRAEAYGVTTSDDPDEWLDDVFVRLAHPVLRAEALAEVADGAVLARRWRGEHPAAGGPVVVCMDCSGSMLGAAEAWAKAFALAVQATCRDERRGFACVAFADDVRAVAVGTSLAAALDVAGVRVGGGTRFDRPLARAADLVADAGATGGTAGERWDRADVVLVTDGEGVGDPGWEAAWTARATSLGVRVWAVYVGGGGPPAVLRRVCADVRAVGDLTSAEEVASLVRAL